MYEIFKKVLGGMAYSVSKFLKGRPLQEIFDVALESGHYHTQEGMCACLMDCVKVGLLTDVERRKAIRAIEEYLGSRMVYLYRILGRAGLPNSPYQCKQIYKNWANRPKLKR